jgi:hypothetical protein
LRIRGKYDATRAERRVGLRSKSVPQFATPLYVEDPRSRF